MKKFEILARHFFVADVKPVWFFLFIFFLFDFFFNLFAIIIITNIIFIINT